MKRGFLLAFVPLALFVLLTVFPTDAMSQTSSLGSGKGGTKRSRNPTDVTKAVSPDGRHVAAFLRNSMGEHEFLYQDRRTKRVTFIKESTTLEGIWSPNSRYFLLTDHVLSNEQFCEIYKVSHGPLSFVRRIDLGHPIPALAKDVDHSWVNGIAWSRNSRCVYVEAAAHGAPALRGMEALPGEVYTQEGFYLINALTGRLIRELTIDDIRRKNRKYYEYWLWREGKPGEPRKHG